MDYDIINVVREEQRVMGFPGEIRKKNMWVKTHSWGGRFCLPESVRVRFEIPPHAKCSITYPWSYEELKETSGGGASGRLIGNWRCCLCWSYWDPSPCFLSPSLPRHQEVDYPHQAEVQSSCTVDRKRWSYESKQTFLLFAHFIYLLPSFFFAWCGLCVHCGDCMCAWVWSPEVALASFSMGVRVPNSGPHASAGSAVMAVLSPQPPFSLKLLPRVFWHSKSANRKRKLS